MTANGERRTANRERQTTDDPSHGIGRGVQLYARGYGCTDPDASERRTANSKQSTNRPTALVGAYSCTPVVANVRTPMTRTPVVADGPVSVVPRRRRMPRWATTIAIAMIIPTIAVPAQERPRARDIGITPGIFRTGEHNAITDVSGVLVGQVTVVDGDSVNTGITAIRPHPGNIFLERVPAAVHVGNGFGKLAGSTQVGELGELETPILLTCTLCVWKAADAMVEWALAQPGMASVRSINPVVGETNDGGLNAIRSRPISAAQVVAALNSATGGPVEEGSVGAGRGTTAYGWKAGIGTSSRKLPQSMGGWTVGALVQSNHGGVLQMDGLPVGEALGRHSYRNQVMTERGDGSIIIVIATDAPLTERQLERLAARGMMGLARTGADGSHGSGDYVIAFSAAESVRRPRGQNSRQQEVLVDDAISPVFLAAIEATEEAIYNSLLKATAVTSKGRTVEALPIAALRELIAAGNGNRE